MKEFFGLLQGGDLRSIGQSHEIVKLIKTQEEFDQLFQYLFYQDRLITMRTADVIEKVTLTNPKYLSKHKSEILELSESNPNKEVKWHLALLVSRLSLQKAERAKIWKLLSSWALNKKESRIVRVNSIQGLFNLLRIDKQFASDFDRIIAGIDKENIPSLNARIKKLNKESS